ncbi:MAG: glycosyltransferase, partial [Nanoarchaeota archaeon]
MKNCIQSIFEFIDLDDIDILVLDNGSSEKGTHEYLNSLRDVDIHIFPNRVSHELHRAMNFAIQYSRKKNNKYINFIQEDYQYLYKIHELTGLVNDAFNTRDEIAQIQTNFGWKIKASKIGKYSVIDINGNNWFYFHNKPPCDNGIT